MVLSEFLYVLEDGQEQESTDSSDDNDDDYSVESSVEEEALEIDVQQVHGGGGRERARMGQGVLV